MAGQGAKKRLQENKKRLQLLQRLLVAGLIAQLTKAALALRAGSLDGYGIAGLLTTTGVAWFCFSGISSLAAPAFDEKGELVDGGADLNMGGFNGYYHDVLYITVFVQVMTLVSSWFWYTYLAVPGYGLYKLLTKLVIPHFKTQLAGGPKEPALDDATRKRLEKAEKRAERRRMKWS